MSPWVVSVECGREVYNDTYLHSLVQLSTLSVLERMDEGSVQGGPDKRDLGSNQ